MIARIFREFMGEKPKSEATDAQINQLLREELAIKERLATAAEREINKAWKAYAILSGLIGVFLSFLILGAALLGWKNYTELLEEVRTTAKSTINSRIDSEFETDRIRHTISLVASNEASGLLMSQIRPDVERFGTILTNQMNHLGSISSNAFRIVAELEGQAAFLSLMNAAIAGSRSNYLQLANWARDPTHPFASRAQQAKILAAKLNFYSPLGAKFVLEWQAGIDPATLSFGDLAKAYYVSKGHLRGSMIEIIWKRDDIPKRNRMQFLVTVIEEEEDLNAVFTAVHFFASEAKLPMKSEEFETYSKWWESNKGNFQ